MEMQQIIAQAEQNIRQTLQDYRRYTTRTEVLDDVSDTFIRNLARDSSLAKQGLRELFSRSPVWDEKLDVLVINGTRTHNPDYGRVRSLATEILYPAIKRAETGKDRYYKIYNAIDFFYPFNGCLQEAGIQAISELAPKACEPGKKGAGYLRHSVYPLAWRMKLQGASSRSCMRSLRMSCRRGRLALSCMSP